MLHMLKELFFPVLHEEFKGPNWVGESVTKEVLEELWACLESWLTILDVLVHKHFLEEIVHHMSLHLNMDNGLESLSSAS